MYKVLANSGEAMFVFNSLLLGNSNLADTAGVALELTQIKGTTPITIPLASLPTYMAGRPLLTTVQIRQEYSTFNTDQQTSSYFDSEQRNVFVVERNTRNQTAKITQVWCTNMTR